MKLMHPGAGIQMSHDRVENILCDSFPYQRMFERR